MALKTHEPASLVRELKHHNLIPCHICHAWVLDYGPQGLKTPVCGFPHMCGEDAVGIDEILAMQGGKA
jgi:hypothetical protein